MISEMPQQIVDLCVERILDSVLRVFQVKEFQAASNGQPARPSDQIVDDLFELIGAEQVSAEMIETLDERLAAISAAQDQARHCFACYVIGRDLERRGNTEKAKDYYRASTENILGWISYRALSGAGLRRLMAGS